MQKEARLVLIFTIVALLWACVAGARPLALGLLTAGLAVQIVLAIRLVRTTLGGVGGHAEWVRAVALRPRLDRSPGWGVGVALAVAGVIAALTP